MARLFDDASSEYLGIASAVISGPPFTMACWGWTDDLTAQRALMFCGYSSYADQHYTLELRGQDAGDPITGWARAGNDARAATTAGPSASAWFHAAYVESAVDSRAVYLDGANKGTNATSSTPTAPDATAIGRNSDSTPGQYWSGYVAEAGIWNVALTDAEVASLAAGYSPLFVRPQSLVAYWPLIRDEDQDRVGGYDMTAYNTPAVAAHPAIIYPAQVYQSFSAAGAPPAGPSIPVFMHHYRQQGMI